MGQPGLTPPPGAQELPLSLSQREVWLDTLAWPDSPHLNIGGRMYLVGRLDVDRFKQAMKWLIEENDALRLVPRPDGRQWRLAQYEGTLEEIDFSREPDPEASMQAWQAARMQVPFKLGEVPPWRFALLKARDDLHLLINQFHHTLMDGWGTARVVQRWNEIYQDLEAGRTPAPPEHPDYLAFIQESLDYRNSPAFERDADYWRSHVGALPEPLFEPRYAGTPRNALPDARVVRHPIKRADYNALEQVAQTGATTIYHWFLAALAIYLARISRRTSVLIGVPSLNRGGKRFKATLGMFVGVLPLRIEIDPEMTVADAIASVTALLRNAYRHPRFPVSELGRELEVIKHGRAGLFDVLLSYERQDYTCHFGEARGIEPRQTFSGKARYPLGLTVCEFQADQDVDLIVEGSAEYFSAEEVAAFGPRLQHLLNQMQAEPGLAVGRLSLLPDAEREAQLRLSGQVRDTCPPPYIRQFETWVDRQPEALALVWDGGQMTYAELDGVANQVCRRLQGQGVQRGDIVALALPRGAAYVVGVLAVSKAGAAFLPLDTEAPVARVGDILQQSQARVLLLDEDDWARYAELDVRRLLVRLEATEPEPESGSPVEVAPSDLAYVLFTSGSTGRPKGVMLWHEALARRLAWIAEAWSVTAADRSALGTQITFDPSLIELLTPLIRGASVALPPPGRLPPERLAEFAVAHRATFMAFVPSTLRRFLDGLAGRTGVTLRVACCGGEVLSADLAERFARETGATLYNVYGPTEATIFATAWRCAANGPWLDLPIGAAVDDSRVYVLDGERRLLPFGCVGDIYLGGPTLAHGYLNRPELDAESFAEDPFLAGGRLYLTGDRGWLDSEGRLHFAGRVDRQVKLRGYRIELGEIENALHAVPGVLQAAVKRVDGQGKPALHAWVTSAQPMAEDFLRKSLAARLPDYMLPARFHALAEMPLRESGKIDYAALVETAAPVVARPSRPPNGAMEIDLLAIWREALGQPELSVTDDFFDRGGDSLAAVSILAGIEQKLGRKVALHRLVEHPSPAAMAEALAEELGLPGLMVSLGTTTRHATLYLAASGHGDLLRFKALAEAMRGACDLHMLQPPGNDFSLGLTELAGLYADRIEARGDRDVYLAGFSVGGLAALETARLLGQRGVRVPRLFLVDTVLARLPPGGFLLWRMLAWIARHTPLLGFSVNGRRLSTTLNDRGLYGQVSAMHRYHPEPYAAPALLLKSSGLTPWDRWLFAPWRTLLPRLDEAEMAGLHGTLFEPGHIEALATLLATHIEAGEQGSPGSDS
ncbi:MAG: non-ribosomal peptide synthetase [Pseudomonadota bacterium]